MPMNMILTYVLCDAVPLKPEHGKIIRKCRRAVQNSGEENKEDYNVL